MVRPAGWQQPLDKGWGSLGESGVAEGLGGGVDAFHDQRELIGRVADPGCLGELVGEFAQAVPYPA
ncbi:MAG: hypothetical protein ACR2JQ_02430, partial [Mycobacteriales bacterium]